MEFKFRSIDSQPENNFPKTTASTSSSPSPSLNASTTNGNCNRSFLRSFQTELEKQQIREEIMASEITRRRILEAEVRMELMAERERVAMQRVWNEGLSFEQRATMRLNSRFSFANQLDDLQRWRFESFLPPPPQLTVLPPVLATEVLENGVKQKPEGNKDKLITLDKPNPNRVVGANWKTPPSTGAWELPVLLTSLKKPSEEWSCAICQVGATCEKGFMEHLQGKKHKAKEASLREQRMANNSTTNLLDKSPPRKHAKVAEETVDRTDQKLDDKEKVENTKDEVLVKEKKTKNKRWKMLDKCENVKNLEPTTVVEVEKTPESTLKKKHKTLCCELCGVVAHSEVVMENHKKGKKHNARLRKLDKKDKVDNKLDGNQMSKDTNAMANECKEKLIYVPTVNEHSSLADIQMAKETDLKANEANEKLICLRATSATTTISEPASLDQKLIDVPTNFPTNTVNEQSSPDDIQMAKETDLTANEANEKLICVPQSIIFS